MEPEILSAATGVLDIIKDSFSKVFRDANWATETWFQRAKLKTVCRDRYADYIARSVGVFPLFGTTRTANVASSYVRLGLSSELERERYRETTEIQEGLKRQQMGRTIGPDRQESGKDLIDVLEATSHGIALLGNPGSGKTTIFRHLALLLAKGTTIRGRRRLPIYLAVRDLHLKNQGIHGAAVEFLQWLEVPEAQRVVDSLLHSGDAAILLDGLDEVESAYQANLVEELRQFRVRFSKSVICVSARPYSLAIGLAGFEKWETLSFTYADRLLFVKRWFEPIDKQKGERLLSECGKDPGLLDLGSSPLMLSIVCALYNNDLKIPSEPDELYARMLDGLLGAWDAFRNIARHTVLRDLSVRRRVTLLSRIAAEMFSGNRVVFSARDIASSGCLDRFSAAAHVGVPDAAELLKSLYNDFGILVERAPGLYSFSHLTFQEYLTAQWIVDQRTEIDVLVTRLNRTEWFEVIRLVAKMLPRADQFMQELTARIDLSNVHHMQLLRAVWEMRPLCERELAKRLISTLTNKIWHTARSLGASFKSDGDILIVELKGYDFKQVPRDVAEHIRVEQLREVGRKRNRSERAINSLRNLPYIVEVVRAAGFNFVELGCARNPPFDRVLWMQGVQEVEIVGF